MKELLGNIFDLATESGVDSICITTNGIINNNGLASMGAGTAGRAASLWPNVRANLGRALKTHGNVPYVIGYLDNDGAYHDPDTKAILNKKYKCLIWSFPTKDDFRFDAKLDLIQKSAELIVKMADKLQLQQLLLPLPGCGPSTGKLSYKNDVKPLLSKILDDRFVICYLDSDKID